jgi:hypothetical protein
MSVSGSFERGTMWLTQFNVSRSLIGATTIVPANFSTIIVTVRRVTTNFSVGVVSVLILPPISLTKVVPDKLVVTSTGHCEAVSNLMRRLFTSIVALDRTGNTEVDKSFITDQDQDVSHLCFNITHGRVGINHSCFYIFFLGAYTHFSIGWGNVDSFDRLHLELVFLCLSHEPGLRYSEGDSNAVGRNDIQRHLEGVG